MSIKYRSELSTEFVIGQMSSCELLTPEFKLLKGVQMAPNQSPKLTLESVAALRGSVSGSAALLRRYVLMKNYAKAQAI
jgi:hypothetical protein